MNNIKSLVLFLCIALLTLSAYGQNRVSITWKVLKYEIDATLPQNFASDRDLDVVATLRLKNVSDTAFSRLTLRISDQAVISSVAVNGSAADFRKSEESIGGSRKLQRAIVSLPSIDPGVEYTVKATYKLKVVSNSGLNALSPIGSQFLPLSFWYPTPNSWFFTGGADYAPYTLRVNNQGGATILGAGQMVSAGSNQMLNGHPFFTLGEWDKSESNGVEVFAPKGGDARSAERVKDLAGFTAEARDFVSGLSGQAIPVPLRIVGVSRGAGFSDGGVVFVDDNVFRREKLDAQTAMNIVEGITRVWLGNQVEVFGEGYGVIREGLSKYIANLFLEKKYGKEIADVERLRQRINYSAIADRDAPLSIVSPVDGYYYTATGNKGAMIWKFLFSRVKEDMFKSIRASASDGNLSLDELRSVFSAQKEHIDYMVDGNTSMNLMTGLPRQQGNQTRVALRNISEVAATVDVVGFTAGGTRLTSNVTIQPNGFGEAVFRSPEKIVRTEVDPEKIDPQTNYVDDISPRAISENDPILFIKRDFDRQRFLEAEKNAKVVLSLYPNFDEARVLLGRALLAQGKVTEAQSIFRSVLDGKLPMPSSMARAYSGLGELAAKTGLNAKAGEAFEEALRVDADFGATLAARLGRNKLGPSPAIDPQIATFFNNFDSAVSANDKARIDSLVVPGEVSRFASGVAGQAQRWTTKVLRVDTVGPDTVLVEMDLNVRLLNREDESGLAVFGLSKTNGVWKLSSVEIFEVG